MKQFEGFWLHPKKQNTSLKNLSVSLYERNKDNRRMHLCMNYGRDLLRVTLCTHMLAIDTIFKNIGRTQKGNRNIWRKIS